LTHRNKNRLLRIKNCGWICGWFCNGWNGPNESRVPVAMLNQCNYLYVPHTVRVREYLYKDYLLQ
jgi:hypothetical protein